MRETRKKRKRKERKGTEHINARLRIKSWRESESERDPRNEAPSKQKSAFSFASAFFSVSFIARALSLRTHNAFLFALDFRHIIFFPSIASLPTLSQHEIMFRVISDDQRGIGRDFPILEQRQSICRFTFPSARRLWKLQHMLFQVVVDCESHVPAHMFSTHVYNPKCFSRFFPSPNMYVSRLAFSSVTRLSKHVFVREASRANGNKPLGTHCRNKKENPQTKSFTLIKMPFISLRNVYFSFYYSNTRK